MVEKTAQQLGYEARDVNVRGVVWSGAGLLASAVVIHLALAGLFVLFSRTHPSPEAASRIVMRPRTVAPEPRLQTDPSADLQRFEASEEEKLNNYGWIDRDRGIIRIPIERAMEITVQRGLPTRGPNSHDRSGKTPEQMRQERASRPVKGEK